ncbi:MAG: hypothetical protein L0211_07125 [Planctomycetaceae bacterium]|nr:hypothetical protein [Planctomycetaceae bacterium]
MLLYPSLYCADGETAPSDDFDSPWKEALQRYLRSFLLFSWPDIHADVDWSRG